jgi:pimeloyl-ACP methyl ester carboxylesterase
MISLNYKSYGSGSKSLVIIHGFLGSLDNWHSLSTQWGAAGLQVFSLDMRNHGKSPHTATHSIELMSADVIDFILDKNLSDVILLGHSMGGKVAMHAALRYPNLIKQLIVADMAPKKYQRGHDDVFDAIQSVHLNSINSRKDAEEEMKAYLGDFGTRQFILKNLERTPDNKYQWKFNLETLYRDYDAILEEITFEIPYTHPTLFLKGDLSLYVKEKDYPNIYALFPNAHIQSIANAGHWLHADQPAEFFQRVISFIN